MLACSPAPASVENQRYGQAFLLVAQFRRRSRDLMSGTHQRTWQQYHVGHLLITVQLDSAATGRQLERHQELAGVTRRLISLADSERLPVTWAVSDPAHSAAT